MLLSLFFHTLVISRMVVCKTSSSTQAPSVSPLDADNVVIKKSVKIINSCDVGTTEIKVDASTNSNCIYQNSSKGLCFYFGERTASYEGASRECAKLGMELASITQPQILDLLTGMINKQNASEDYNLFWVNIPNSTWESIGNWSTEYSRYYNNTCDGKYKDDTEKKSCPFVMAKAGNTKMVLRQMEEESDCISKLKVFCQGRVPLDNRLLPISNPEDQANTPTLAIIAATSVGVLVLLIILGILIRSLRKTRIHSHNRMQNSTKSDTSYIEDKKNEDRYAVAKQANGTLKDNKGEEYADYAELEDGVSVDRRTIETELDNDMTQSDDAVPPTNGDDGGEEEPCYFVLNKQASVESLQHTYEDCAFRDRPSTSSLPMRNNPLALTLPAVRRTDETDENVYDWPDLLQPTTNYSAKTRRTQSETEPQYFSLEIEANDESENIYDCVFPIDEPIKKSPKASRTKHLSLQRKKRKTKQLDHVKTRFTGGIRK